MLQSGIKLADDRFVEMVIREVPKAVRGSAHTLKYRVALVVNEVCVLRYDNETGNGDHRHVGGVETPYTFTSVDRLLEDFRAEVARL